MYPASFRYLILKEEAPQPGVTLAVTKSAHLLRMAHSLAALASARISLPRSMPASHLREIDHGEASAWPDRSRPFPPRLRLRRGRRAAGAGDAGRAGTRGRAGARTRRQLLRHCAALR